MTGASVPAGGLYLHVPFCRTICPYCDFTVIADRDRSLHRQWVDAMAEVLKAQRPTFRLRTIYLGGGTPGRIDPAALRDVLSLVPVAQMREVTLEANPEDLDEHRLEAWRELGITRLSVGVQRLDREGLRRLGRAASYRAIVELPRYLAMWRDQGGQASVDLIYGLLGDTPAQIASQVRELLTWPIDHLSAYALTIEPDTPFGRATRRGRRFDADPDATAACYRELVRRIEAAGWEAYEVSNFCRPGCRAVHNSGYWERRPYLGHGPGAASLLPVGDRWERFVRPRNFRQWLRAPGAVVDREVVDPRTELAEGLSLGLRSDVGVPESWLRLFREARPRVVDRLFEAGELVLQRGRVVMPALARLRAEEVAALWLASVDRQGGER